jgi:hypothetical protein
MIIDALLDGYYIPNITYQIDAVKGKTITLLPDAMPEGAEVFASNDKVLGIEITGKNIHIDTLAEGASKIRIMTGTSIDRELLINVVGSVGLPATSINATFSDPVPR